MCRSLSELSLPRKITDQNLFGKWYTVQRFTLYCTCSEIHTGRDLAGKESMAEGDDLIDEAFLYELEKKYPGRIIIVMTGLHNLWSE